MVIFSLFLITVQIFKITILEKKYGKDKAYFIISLILLLVIPYSFFVLYPNGKIINWIITAISLFHILYSSYIMKFKNKENE